MGDPNLAYRIVRDHWDLFLRRQFQPLAKALDVPLRELEPAVDVIRALRKTRARLYTKVETPFVTGIRKSVAEALDDLV